MSSPESQIELRVSEQLTSKGSSIRNRAALGALIKIIPTFGESLYHALTAGDKAIEDEKIKIQLNLLCELVEQIDLALTTMLSRANEQGAPFAEIAGSIHVTGEDTTNITGLDASSGRPVSIKPGTVITVEGKNAATITGVKL